MADDYFQANDVYGMGHSSDGEMIQLKLVDGSGVELKAAIPFPLIDTLSLQLMRMKEEAQKTRTAQGKPRPTEIRTLQVSQAEGKIALNPKRFHLILHLQTGQELTFVLPPEAVAGMARMMSAAASDLDKYTDRKPS